MPTNHPAVSPDFDDNLDVMMQEFQASMQCLQMQDLNGSEKSFIKVRNIYKNIAPSITENETIFCKTIVTFIEIVTRLLKSAYYTFEERNKKAAEELIEAGRVCDETNIAFKQIPPDFFEDDDMADFFEIFRFFFVFYKRIISTTLAASHAALLREEGKFVDEIQMYRRSAQELKMINEENFDINNNFAVMGISMLNRIAEMYDKKAEKLEEKRKKIEFMQPVDKRVFIVHGHDEGILRELKEMLVKDFNIEPIILRDEKDDGDTVIEKFEEYGRLCAFAFVIVTADDWVENKKKKYFQARPNVLFELGWFCGRFGRDKVRILCQKGTALPSDLGGIIPIEFNERLEEAFRKIKGSLENAGILQSAIAVDHNK